MIIREKFYIDIVNLEIDIFNSRLMKSSGLLSTRSWILLDKVRRNFAPCYVGRNCMKS